MSLELRAVPESGSAQVRQFLRSVFDSPEDALYIAPAQMHWKYWEPHPHWTGSRSYAYFDEAGEIAAHACAWPFGLRTVDGTLAGAHPIDWAAGMKIPGAGALLLRQIRSLRDISCCIGGTDIAQKVIRQTGFKPVATMKSMALPLRPVRQALTHQRVNWKLPARLIRNAAWKMNAAKPPSGWSASLVEPHELHDGLLPAPSEGCAVPIRSVALFEYLEKCPTAQYQVWLIRQEPRTARIFSAQPRARPGSRRGRVGRGRRRLASPVRASDPGCILRIAQRPRSPCPGRSPKRSRVLPPADFELIRKSRS